jgi:hypothetical protein
VRTKVITGAVVIGAGAAMIAGGIAATVLSRQEYDEIHTPASGYVFNPDTQDAMKRNEILGPVFIGVGAAAAVAGGVVLGLGMRERSRASRVSVAPLLAPDRAGASVRLAF